jgi:hypothetical protein
LAALAQARDAVLFAREFIVELKVELAALHTLAIAHGYGATTPEQAQGHVLFGLV